MNESVPEEVPVYDDLIEVAGDPEALMTSPPLARQQDNPAAAGRGGTVVEALVEAAPGRPVAPPVGAANAGGVSQMREE